VGSEVERKFSGFGQFFARLPGSNANDARRQDRCQFGQAVGWGHVVGVERIEHAEMLLSEHHDVTDNTRTESTGLNSLWDVRDPN